MYSGYVATGFCDAETISLESGTTYYWPETLGGEVATFTCPSEAEVVVTRSCSVGGVWLPFNEGACEGVSEQLNELSDSFTNVCGYD